MPHRNLAVAPRALVTNPPLHARAALPPAEAQAFLRDAIFSCCKWDPQIGDHRALANFPLIINPQTWRQLAVLAEQLARETEDLETALLARPALLAELGLPRAVRQVLSRSRIPSQPAFRIMRFDFHLTTDGWRVSEVNSDVPGGFIEASGVARLMAAHHPDCALPGDPVQAIVAAFARRLPERAAIGLVHATAFSDDRQSMVYLAREIEATGLRPVLLSPDNLRWHEARCHSIANWHREELGALLRFFPAEWLPNLPRATAWQHHFAEGCTPAANPAWAIVSQSKRLALAAGAIGRWQGLWSALQPETRDPSDVPSAEADEWIYKPSLGRVGEFVGMAGVTPDRELKRIRRNARWFRRDWACQRRFDALSIITPDGPAYPCLGIYVIEGRAAGIYGRISRQPLINATAQDVAVLVGASG